jgi:hypothetical protein
MSAPTGTITRPSLPDVVEEHLEELGFLCAQRRKLMFSLEYPVRRMPQHEERMNAHWDGLLVNAPLSGSIAEERLEADDPWERAAAIRTWLTVRPPAIKDLLARWEELPPDHLPSWREALRSLEDDAWTKLQPHAGLALPATAIALLTDAEGWRGQAARALTAARHDDAQVRGSAARALGLADPAAAVTDALSALARDADESVRRRALWGLVAHEPQTAMATARSLVRGESPNAFAVRAIGLLGGDDALRLLSAAAATEPGRPAAFFALADLGTPDAIDTLIRLLTLPAPEQTLFVTMALERALGTIPREAPDAPATPDEARAHLESLPLPRDSRVHAGRPWPSRANDPEEMCGTRWRRYVGRADRVRAFPHPHVPDGFFSGVPAEAAEPGV